jgi:acetyl esterase/lipase
VRVTRDMIDPQLRLPGAVLKRLLGTDRTPQQLRRPFPSLVNRLLSRTRLKGVLLYQEWIPRRDGSMLRVVIATSTEPAPGAAGVLWIHGGGYASGSPDWEVSAMRALIQQGNCVVVSPDYRLSPQVPYPAALDDCYDALLWLRDHAPEYGVRSDQLAVAGASAGGGLAAAVSLYARDRGEVNLAFQMPIYPMIDDRGETESGRDNDAPVWDSGTNASAWRLYLGPLYGTDEVPAHAAPARATDLSGLPPTITFVGGIEPFRDETIAYVEALRAAGVPVRFELLPGAWHGFDGLVPWSRVAGRARAFQAESFRHALAHWFAEQPSR